MSAVPTGIDAGPVTAWMTNSIPTLVPPLTFELITGGASNLTFLVTDDEGGRWVLRRPPTGHVLASAHDMAREHRIIAALADTPVPVPPAIGLCQDEAVNGADFYVMGFVEGEIVFDRSDGEAYDPSKRQGLAASLVDTLVDLHALEPAAVGLGDLGRTEDYCARQLRRWKRQVDEGSDRDLPLFQELHTRLVDGVPPQQGAGIVHGDYRLDNCMAGYDGTIAAVLDWELCTLVMCSPTLPAWSCGGVTIPRHGVGWATCRPRQTASVPPTTSLPATPHAATATFRTCPGTSHSSIGGSQPSVKASGFVMRPGRWATKNATTTSSRTGSTTCCRGPRPGWPRRDDDEPATPQPSAAIAAS